MTQGRRPRNQVCGSRNCPRSHRYRVRANPRSGSSPASTGRRASACQISITASGTMCAAAVADAPVTIATPRPPPVLASTPSPAGAEPIVERTGPTVCDGRQSDARARQSPSVWRSVPAARCRTDSRVPRPGSSSSQSNGRSAGRARARRGCNLKDGIVASSGSPGKYIWVTSRVEKARRRTRKNECGRDATRSRGSATGRRPGVIVTKRYRPSTSVSTRPAAGEVRIERRVVLVVLVRVAAGGIRLPDFDQRVAHGAAVFVHHAPLDDDPLAERLAGVLAGQIGVGGADTRPWP